MFNFSHHMERLVRDIVSHTPDLAHIDCDRVLVTVSQQRKFGSSGLYAKLVPLRFERGAHVTKEHGHYWGVPQFLFHGREILYVLSFCLPRFQNITFEKKGETVLHELLHINPHFDGDLRRFPGKYYQHGPDARAYDRHASSLFERYCARATAPHLLAFLRSRFHNLEDRYGSVLGLTVRTPAPQRLRRPDERLAPRDLPVQSRVVVSARSRMRRAVAG